MSKKVSNKRYEQIKDLLDEIKESAHKLSELAYLIEEKLSEDLNSDNSLSAMLTATYLECSLRELEKLPLIED